MVTVFYKTYCTSSKKTMEWFETNHIAYTKCQIKSISKDQLISILRMTDHGIEDIVKKMEI
ncbi:hypothetical protein [Lactococcus garvieae]|uniref:hypothetical protein n=1 Tax=Lactococcus garvieae TaxID=1363 RepID=UPI00398E3A46